jgi:hypothetical protein
MDQSFLSALIGLSGAVIGSTASFATTYLTRRTELREQRSQRQRRERQQLYAAFISEASRLYADALSHEKDDVTDMVQAYALVGQIRLTAPSEVTGAAEDVLDGIAHAYVQPNKALHELHILATKGGMDPLAAFSDACRADLAGCEQRRTAEIPWPGDSPVYREDPTVVW